MRTVIFDLDGTLADTSADLIAAANATTQRFGYEPQLVAGMDDAIAFAGGRAMLKLAAERLELTEYQDLIEDGYPLLLEAYGAAIDTHTSFYPGAIEAVDRLLAQGDAVGICTNKPEALAIELLNRFNVLDRFKVLIGADTLPVRKPAPEPVWETIARLGGSASSSVLVGDTVTDRKAAAAAGIRSVLVRFGPTGNAVEELEPDALLDDYAQLDVVLDGLFERAGG